MERLASVQEKLPNTYDQINTLDIQAEELRDEINELKSSLTDIEEKISADLPDILTEQRTAPLGRSDAGHFRGRPDGIPRRLRWQ